MPARADHERRRASSVDATTAFSWRFTTPLFMGSALNPINSSIIATALVPIAAGLRIPIGQTAALIAVLYLASAISQPTAGKLAEEFGPRRVFVAGILLVLTGGLVGGFGQDMTMLIVSRILIGVGTSAGYPSAMLLIRRRAEDAGMAQPPGGVLGGLQIAAMVTAAVGLPIGGVLIGVFGWRATFFVNVPVALVTLALLTAGIPADRPVNGSRSVAALARRLDILGIVGFGGTVSALLVFLMALPEANWVALAVAVVLGVALVAWELRAGKPFLDIRMLARHKALTRTYVRFALSGLIVYTVLYGLTQWIEDGRGLSAEQAGLLILPMSVVSALIVRPISRRNLLRGPLVAAAGSALVASIGVLFLSGAVSIVLVAVVTPIFGVTMGTMSIGNQTALYKQVTVEQIGTAAGLLRTFGYLGSIASSAVIAIVFRSGAGDGGLHVVAIVMIVVSALLLLVTLADRGLMSTARAK